jgi:hypothetical protein
MHVIGMLNSKGGVGKTTLTACLAVRTVHDKASVAVLDLDPSSIGPALAPLFSSVGLYWRGKGASAMIVRVEWSGREPLQTEGP